jgi:hypothetical protein
MFNSVSKWILSKFLANVDAGACLPPECCAHQRRNNCSGACIVYYPACR